MKPLEELVAEVTELEMYVRMNRNPIKYGYCINCGSKAVYSDRNKLYDWDMLQEAGLDYVRDSMSASFAHRWSYCWEPMENLYHEKLEELEARYDYQHRHTFDYEPLPILIGV